MANRFWVGGSATWDATVGTKWATTSGGAGGASVPTSADDVFLDASSGANTVTLSASSVMRSLNCTGFTGTLSHPASLTINIGDATAGASNVALLMVAGMTYSRGNTATSIFQYVSTSTTVQTITTGGKAMGGAIFNGIGGKWQFADTIAFGGGSTVQLLAGQLDTNGQAVSFQAFNSSTTTNARTLILGASVISIGGIGVVWNTATTNFTLTVNTGTIQTTNTTSTAQFTTGGVTMPNLIVNGAGGTTQFLDGFTTAGQVTLTAGTLNTNGQTCSWNNFDSNNTNTRTLTLGASAITITGGSGATPRAWYIPNQTGMTNTATTAVVTFTSSNSVYVYWNNPNGASISCTTANTFLLANAGSSYKDITYIRTTGQAFFSISGNTTATGILTIKGGAGSRLQIGPDSFGGTNTVSAGTLVAEYLDVEGVVAGGTANWDISAITGLSGDCGGNTGITFTTAVAQSWVGTSGGSWNTSGNWSSRVPLPQDDVNISTAFIASQTITANVPRLGNNINFTGTTGNPILSFSTGVSVYGSITLVAGMTTSGGNQLIMRGKKNVTITTAGVTINLASVAFRNTGFTCTLSDSFTGNNVDFFFQRGTLNLNGQTVNIGTAQTSITGSFVLTMGASILSLNKASTTTWLSTTTNFTLTVGTGTIQTTNTSGTAQITTGGVTMPKFTVNGLGGTTQLLGAFTTAGAVTLTRGTLDTNGQTCSWGTFVSTSALSGRVLTLGASAITITGASTTVWSVDSTFSGITINAGTSTITCSGASATFAGGNFATYNNLVLSGSGVASIASVTPTFANVTRTGTAVKTDGLTFATTTNGPTITGTLTLNSNSLINRLIVKTSIAGVSRTISVGTLVCTNAIDFMDITTAGTATWTTGASGATYFGDCGGNTGITFTTPVSQIIQPASSMTGSFLRKNGAVNDAVSTADSPALSITSDIDIRVKVAMDDWTPTQSNELFSKYVSGGTSNSWLFRLDTLGKLNLYLTADGTNAVQAVSTVATGVADGAVKWVRATWNNATDICQFFTSDDGLAWTQLGTDRSLVLASIFDGTASVEVGSYTSGLNPCSANIYQAQLRNGINGTVVYDADFTAQSVGTKSFIESSSNGATVAILSTSVTWSTVPWSGGRVPLPQDDVTINNAFLSGKTITVDMPRLGKNVDFSGMTGAPTHALSTATASVYGNLAFCNTAPLSGGNVYLLGGRSSHTLTSGPLAKTHLTVDCATGTYTLQDDWIATIGKVFTLSTGTLDMNNHNLQFAFMTSSNANVRSLIMGTGTFILDATGTGAVWQVTTGTNWTLSGANGTITCYDTPASAKTIIFNTGDTIGTLNIIGGTGNISISRSFTIGNWNITAPANIIMQQSTTKTVTGTINWRGSAGNVITFTSASPSVFWGISKASGIVDCDWLNLTDSIASGGAIFYAGQNSVNGGHNSGWLFTSYFKQEVSLVLDGDAQTFLPNADDNNFLPQADDSAITASNDDPTITIGAEDNSATIKNEVT